MLEILKTAELSAVLVFILWCLTNYRNGCIIYNRIKTNNYFWCYMKNKLYSLFTVSIPSLWGIITSCIMILLLVFHDRFDYRCKFNFGLSNLSLTLIAIFTIIIFTSLYLWKKQKFDNFFSRLSSKCIIISTALFFCIQTIIFYNIFFKTGWDVRQILEASEAIAENAPNTVTQDWYYLRYPNNLLMTWIFSVIIKASNLLGFTGEFSHIFAIILVQCAISCISAYLLFTSVREIINNPVIPYVAWIVFIFNVALNPTLTIPYSDSLALLFPIAVFRIFQLTQNNKFLPIKWFFIALFSYLGYKIKPQVIIILIAIVIYEIVIFLTASDNRKRLCKAIGYSTGVISLCTTVIITNVLLTRLPVRLNDDTVYGFSHFIMMGFNEETGGTYSADDVEFSAQFKTSEERTKANLKVLKERINKFGFLGLTKFMSKKCLTNFGNGVYAWSMEGEFYYDVPEEKNATISPLLRSFYYSYGENYQHFATFQQYMWIIIILGNFGIIFIIRDKKMRSAVAVAVLALIGLTMFEMLFEARARYLFNYSPIFIVTASVGWYAMLKSAASTVTSIKSKIIKKER